MEWEIPTQGKFNAVIFKLPVFHRRIAEEAVQKKACENAALRNAQGVQDQDVISAFFTEVPPPFYSMMIRVLDDSGFDYRKYGFPKDTRKL